MPRHNPKFLDSIVSLERRLLAYLAIGLICGLAAATILWKDVPFLFVALVGSIACYLLALISISIEKERRGFYLHTTNYDLTIRSRIDLINSASRSILFVAGPFQGEFWKKKETLEALKTAAQRKVSIRGLWGSDKDNRNEEFLEFAERIGIKLIKLAAFPNRHFILADNMNVRWEHWHPEDSEQFKEVPLSNFMINRNFLLGCLCRFLFLRYKLLLREK